MAYIASIIMSVVSAMTIFVLQNVIKDNKKLREDRKVESEERQKAIGDAVLNLLKIQLIEYHDRYMTGEHIPSYVYENFDEMYKAYKALGGNGMITHMKADLDKLRVTNKSTKE